MENTEFRAFGIGAEARHALMLEEKTDENRARVEELMMGAGLNGLVWYAAKHREPARFKLMVVGKPEHPRVPTTVRDLLTRNGIEFEEVSDE